MSVEMRSTIKGTGIDFFLEKARLLGYPIKRMEIYDTAGDIRPPYPFQFFAFTDIPPGADDPVEGKGGTPYEAVRACYLSLLVELTPPTESEE